MKHNNTIMGYSSYNRQAEKTITHHHRGNNLRVSAIQSIQSKAVHTPTRGSHEQTIGVIVQRAIQLPVILCMRGVQMSYVRACLAWRYDVVDIGADKHTRACNLDWCMSTRFTDYTMPSTRAHCTLLHIMCMFKNKHINWRYNFVDFHMIWQFYVDKPF